MRYAKTLLEFSRMALRRSRDGSIYRRNINVQSTDRTEFYDQTGYKKRIRHMRHVSSGGVC